jgi:hypothetical protein
MPVCQARTPEEICMQLERLVFDPLERERVGKAGREYVEKNIDNEKFAQECLSCLNASLTSQIKEKIASQVGLSYYLQQRHLLLKEKIAGEMIIQQNLEREAELVKAASVREAELLDYLKFYAVSGAKVLKRTRLKKPYRQEIGLCWKARLDKFMPIADNEKRPRYSTLLLYEGDKLLQPAHAGHEEIRNLGGGRYSHWKDVLYFSTSDGSNPNTNGREYVIVLVKQMKVS